MNSMPEELDKLERQIRQLEIEREAIKRENDEEKLKELNTEIRQPCRGARYAESKMETGKRTGRKNAECQSGD